MEHEVCLELGNGLEIWKVNIEDLKEQDVNARYMRAEMFERLTENIKADGRLESLPFCALTDRGLEIISGHHRVRASRQAGIYEIYVIVDVTNLSRDKIRSKQLSHNSIDGYDNAELVKRIYDSIEGAKERLEAFVPEDLVDKFKRVSVGDVNVDMDIRQIQIVFFKYEKMRFEKLERYLKDNDEAYAAELKQFEDVKKLIRETGREYNIRAVGTILARLCDLALCRYQGTEPDHKYLADVMRTTLVTDEQSERIEKALKKKDKDETQIEYLIKKLEV